MFAPLVKRQAEAVAKPKAVVLHRKTERADKAQELNGLGGDFDGHHSKTGPHWDFGKIPIFSRGEQPSPPPPRLQRKLAIGSVNDPLEQEADRVAEQVMRMPAPEVESRPAPPHVSRKCAACEAEEEEKLEMKEAPTAEVVPGETPASVDDVLRSPGQPLDDAARAYFEPRFGYDFSRVRVHTDELAGRSAEVVAAEAYTVGPHVVFGPGRYTLASSDGRRLLAHELAHVVWQPDREVIARQPVSPERSKVPVTSKTVFHPGVMHNHQPSGRWADVQKDPKSAGAIGYFCERFSPIWVMRLAALGALRDLPIARDHLTWYFQGGGAVFVEDENLELMLRTDSGVEAKISKNIPSGRSSGTFAGNVTITQDDYSSEEFQFAFGEIDRLDFEVDFANGTLRAWFQDRYEWHPVYPFYKQMPGDYVRPTNCVHAAAVELKSEGAEDYWMKGEIPFMVIPPAASFRSPAPPVTTIGF